VVHLWFNLHRRDWSVKAGRSPVQHRAAVCLSGVVFRVREAGRQRVLANRCREVHAYAAGELCDLGAPHPDAIEVSYNPYRGPLFYRKDTGASVVGAAFVYFAPDGRAFAVAPY